MIVHAGMSPVQMTEIMVGLAGRDYREFRVWLGQYGKEGDVPWPDARNPGSPMLSSTSC